MSSVLWLLLMYVWWSSVVMFDAVSIVTFSPPTTTRWPVDNIMLVAHIHATIQIKHLCSCPTPCTLSCHHRRVPPNLNGCNLARCVIAVVVMMLRVIFTFDKICLMQSRERRDKLRCAQETQKQMKWDDDNDDSDDDIQFRKRWRWRTHFQRDDSFVSSRFIASPRRTNISRLKYKRQQSSYLWPKDVSRAQPSKGLP